MDWNQQRNRSTIALIIINDTTATMIKYGEIMSPRTMCRFRERSISRGHCIRTTARGNSNATSPHPPPPTPLIHTALTRDVTLLLPTRNIVKGPATATAEDGADVKSGIVGFRIGVDERHNELLSCECVELI